MQQKFFIQSFAFAGDKTAIPDALQPSGDVSFNQGYTFDYQRELGVDPSAKAIERAQMNYLFGAITDQLGQYQRESAPEFITAADNGGSAFPYARGAMVRYRATGGDPFLTYVSKVAANTATPTQGASTANWELLIFERASNAQALAGTDNNTIMTPLLVKQAMTAAGVTVPDASETTKGIAEIATQAETNAGTDDLRIVTPKKLSAFSPQATTVVVGRTRYATAAETTALSVTTAAVTPAGLAPLMATKANLAGATFTGAVTINAALVATTFVGNSGGNLSMATTGAATIFLRPNGIGSSTGQTQIAASGNMTVNGSCTATGGFQNGSSERIKHELRPMPYGLADLLGVETFVGKYLPEFDATQRDRLFLIAEQLRPLIPEPVADSTDLREGDSIPTVDYTQLIPVIIQALKELHARLSNVEE